MYLHFLFTKLMNINKSPLEILKIRLLVHLMDLEKYTSQEMQYRIIDKMSETTFDFFCKFHYLHTIIIRYTYLVCYKLIASNLQTNSFYVVNMRYCQIQFLFYFFININLQSSLLWIQLKLKV